MANPNPSIRDDVLSLAGAAVAATATYFLLSGLGLAVGSARCGAGGMETLGCTVVAILIGLLVAMVAAAAVAGVLLYVRRIPKAPLVATFGAAFVGAAWLFLRSLSGTSPVRWAVVAGAFFVAFAAFHALFNLSPLPPVLSGVAGAALIIVAFVLLPRAGVAVDRERSDRRREAQVAQLPFAVYVPERPPVGFRIHDNRLYEGDGVTMQSHYIVSYLYGNNDGSGPPPITIASFARTPYFAPPNDCGHDKPGYEPWPVPIPCTLVGTTADGRQIWFETDEGSNVRAWYTLIDDVQVTITTTAAVGGHDLAHEAITDLVGSLRATPAKELRDLN